jgi:hypothetical protein
MIETINVSAVSSIVKSEVIDQNIISKPSALYSSIKLVKGLALFMEQVLNDDGAEAEQPAPKKQKVGRPPKKTPPSTRAPEKPFRMLVNELKAKVEATDSCKLASFSICEGSLMFSHQVTLTKTNDHNVGRMYPTSSDGVPPLIQLPSIVRAACMSTKRSSMAWVPSVVEIDQKTSHLTIMHWLMIQAGKDPLSVSWMRDIIVNSDKVRREVADHYLEDSNAVLARDLIDRMTTTLGVELVTPAIIEKYVKDKPRALNPCPVKTAKRMINGILYGQSLEAALTENCVVIKTGNEHHPIITKLREAVKELPNIIPSIDNILEERFDVAWVGCKLASKAANGPRAPGQLALLCQTIESAITMRAMESCRQYGLNPVLYAYDGFYVELPKGNSVPSQRATQLSFETLSSFSIDMQFDTKTLDTLVIGTGPLQRPEKQRLEREIHEICTLRMEADADFDPKFIKGAYDILALSGYGDVDSEESSQALDSLAVYASKFFIHNAGAAGMYTRLKWDPIVPGDVISTYAINRQSLGEISHLKFVDALGNERMWLEVLERRLPYQCAFSILPSSSMYNIKPLRRTFGEPSRATTDFTFSLRRECKVVRDNFGKPTDYPQPDDSDEDLLILLELSYTLCGYDTEAFVFLQRIVATRLVRLHEKIPIILQCSSAVQGIGKNTFFEKLIGRLLLGDVRNKFELRGGLGEEEPVLSYLVSQSSMVGGRFNGYEAGLNMIVYDECARISDKQTQSQFKAKTTCDVISIEKKYQEVVQAVNMALSVFLSNYPVSLSVEPGCRRNFLIRVSDFAPRQNMSQTSKLHATIDNENTRWMYYRHLTTCNNIPKDLNELQRDIPLTDHKVAMMAVSDEIVNGIVTILAGHPACQGLNDNLVFSKKCILEAFKSTNPNSNLGWEGLSTRLVAAMVGPMQRHDKVFDIKPDGFRSTFQDAELIRPLGRPYGMDFNTVIKAHRAQNVAFISRAPGDLKDAKRRFINEALPALSKVFTINLSRLQELASSSCDMFF